MLAPLLLAAALSATVEKPVISVLYFDNATGQADFEVMRKGLADMLITDLVAWDGVSVVERDKLESVLGEIKLQKTKSFDQATTVRVGKFVGARYILKGTMSLPDSQLMLDAQLVDVQNGTVTATARARGPRDDIFHLEQKLVEQVTTTLDLKVTNAAARNRAMVPNLEALISYSKAIDLSDRGNAEEAQATLQKLISKSPLFPMAREKREAILRRLAESVTKTKTAAEKSADALTVLLDQAFEKSDTVGDEKQTIALRSLRGTLILRQLEPHTSTDYARLHVTTPGHEAAVMQLLRLWHANQLKLIEAQSQHPEVFGGVSVGEPYQTMIREAQFNDGAQGNVHVDLDAQTELLTFVSSGRILNGRTFDQYAPPLGALDPRFFADVMDATERKIQRLLLLAKNQKGEVQTRTNEDIARILMDRGEALVFRLEDEAAAIEYQRLLDLTPLSFRANQANHAIQMITGVERDAVRADREAWLEALQTCSDSPLRRSVREITSGLQRAGLSSLDSQAEALEKACVITDANVNAREQFYRSLASVAATHLDCARAQKFWLRAAAIDGENRGSAGSSQMEAHGCSAPEAARHQAFMTAKIDGAAVTFDEYVTSNGNKQYFAVQCHGTDKRQVSLSFEIDARGNSILKNCQFRGVDDVQIPGTCEANVTRVAAFKNGIDEGTFSGVFQDEKKSLPAVKITNAVFHSRRN